MPGPPRVTPSWERAAARAVFAVALIVAAAFRLTDLERRPMHGDEANQGVKAGALLERGEYRYDPMEHHGPTLYYAVLPMAWARGQHTLAELDEVSLRLVPALFGIATLALIWTLRGAIGELAAAMAALLTSLSPAFVYYNRYFIQESLLVFFVIAALSAGFRYAARPGYLSAIAFGVSIGLAHATKETFAVVLACLAAAWALTSFPRRRESRSSFSRPQIGQSPRKVQHLLVALAAAIICSVVLYSSFFTNPRGIVDSFLTYANYFRRADGAALHDKPWYYYLSLLAYVHRGPGPWWSEGMVLALAAIGGFAAWRENSVSARFIAFSAAITFAAFSAIAYKTPWNVLVPYQMILLTAGVGVAALFTWFRKSPAKIAVAALVFVGATHLGVQAWRASFEMPADPRTPYVYAHTSSAFMRFVERAEGLAAVHPDGYAMRIDVIQPDGDYWPIPWYLRRFSRVGYWPEVPEHIDAPFIITAPGVYEAVRARLTGEYITETAALRPSVLRAVFIEKGLWDTYMAAKEIGDRAQ